MLKYLLIVICFVSCSEMKKQTSSSTIMENLKIVNVEAEAQIKEILMNQQSAWNSADLEGFMNGYWNDEALSFIGSRGLSRGWQTTLENYKKSYPDAATMGILTFEVLELRPLGKETYYMIGKYSLARKSDNPSGYFNLIWEIKNGAWVITSDHSS